MKKISSFLISLIFLVTSPLIFATTSISPEGMKPWELCTAGPSKTIKIATKNTETLKHYILHLSRCKINKGKDEYVFMPRRFECLKKNSENACFVAKFEVAAAVEPNTIVTRKGFNQKIKIEGKELVQSWTMTKYERQPECGHEPWHEQLHNCH